ncbi:hypothetical protein LEP1GSC116_1904 [Leptospira interrogans serovar Icterohaemorrhagiae str. Verdun HP]|uniref:Uncharacterized protein n=2 Tax=Leptospira interrogans TaxID=173 RepID=M6REI9_LEPIR|nr:hypothetical protein LEP1GSC037_3417 [Leptospira interrogans str. 2006001854]EMO05990.1 hypothetical protein LEP1GSC116_1904 [Leptospira interrogans serovar Icterohaemorrhagiae str. Verdun HP]
MALIGFLIGFGVYAYRIYNRKSFPLDAIIQVEPTLEKTEIYEIRLNELLKRESISAREFSRLLSSYIREKSSTLSGKQTSSFTETELFRFLYDQFPFEKQELMTWKEFLTEKNLNPKTFFYPKKKHKKSFYIGKESGIKNEFSISLRAFTFDSSLDLGFYIL